MSSRKIESCIRHAKNVDTHFHKFIYIHNMCIGNHFNRIIVDTHMNIHENSDGKNL